MDLDSPATGILNAAIPVKSNQYGFRHYIHFKWLSMHFNALNLTNMDLD